MHVHLLLIILCGFLFHNYISGLNYGRRSLMLSQGTQMALSGLGDKGVGLPPASPSDNEQDSSNVYLYF